ncbi:outer membrane protein assembly factor BamB [Candidatus Curculioniphilus buchneri]|uniref:outer membrane protein assembly factor BamB n=1 Tax=Candidatus Curculioniphilus buchneri TaxID=690594 RepID=UPI00376F40E0
MNLHNTIFMLFLLFYLFGGCIFTGSDYNVVIASQLSKLDNQFKVVKAWHCSVGQGSNNFYSNLQLAWQDTYIFAADRNGLVKALDINTGKEIWSLDLSIHTNSFWKRHPAKLAGGITVARHHVYIGSELAKVYALHVHDGSISWMTTVAGEAVSKPVVSDDGVVLIHTGNGMLQALNESDGRLQWTVNLNISPLKLYGESSPAIAFGAAIVGGSDGNVSAISMDQGQLIWKQKISKQNADDNEIAQLHDVKITPVIINEIVYAIAYNGNLVALDLRSGQIIWSRNIGSINNLLVNHGYIYLINQDNQVIAVDIQNGDVIWRQNALQHHNLISPVLYNNYIVTGDSKGYLHWLSTDDGRILAHKKVDNSGILNSPIIARNKLIVQTRNGKVYAFIYHEST